MISPSLKNFPSDPNIKDECSLPWGLSIQPFSKPQVEMKELLNSNMIIRCKKCFAYINPYVKFKVDLNKHAKEWLCCFCNTLNVAPPRYKNVAVESDKLLELKNPFIEYEFVASEGEEDQASNKEMPIFVMFVDLTGTEEFLESVKNSILAAWEVIPPTAYFGIITFSDKIGVFDLKSEKPHVKYIFIPSNDSCSLGIEEIFPFENIFVLKSEYELNILEAIDSLTELKEENTTSETPKRGFGSAVQAIIDFFDQYDDLNNTKVITFLSGIPNYGLGKVEDTPQNVKDINPKNNFFRDQAMRALYSHVSFDMFVCCEGYCSLSTIKFLTLKTGGSLYYYDSIKNSTMPQDVFRYYKGCQAFNCLLRLRMSKECSVSDSYGIEADPVHEGLFRLASCDRNKNFSFALKFETPSGFPQNSGPFVQMAFVYNYFPEEGRIDLKSMRRILRISTVKMGLAVSPQLIFPKVDAYATLALLTQQITRAIFDEGVEEARNLLIEWITLVLSKYNYVFVGGNGPIQDKNTQLDLSFSKCTNLKNLCRYVFALSKNVLLDIGGEGFEADKWTYLQCIYSTLAPPLLRTALYPDMTTFASPNAMQLQHVPLSSSSLITNNDRLVMIDAFIIIIIYYGSGANENNYVFPPEKNTQINNLLQQTKNDRQITPQISFLNVNNPLDYKYFQMFLVEEKGVDGDSLSYTQFLEDLSVRVKKQLGNLGLF